MLPTKQGSIRLFQLAGITVFLHWSWFAVAAYQISTKDSRYSSILWNVLEYVALFVIVLMHEFGHSLACRQVGGRSEQIILWPLGGVAYVAPPQRPGAMLWSIAAGPLVNVVLIPILSGLLILSRWSNSLPDDVANFIFAVWQMNCGLLIFNLLPIYPLDGGQILRSLLWFGLGRTRSLFVASIIGFVGVIGLIVLALLYHSGWFIILCTFIILNCWRGLQEARALSRIDKLPRHVDYTCPACKVSPPRAPVWLCGHCRNPCDIFSSLGQCPHCGVQFVSTRCFDCGVTSPLGDWIGRAPPMPKL
jgi:Zn-dependent protease